MRNNKRLTVFGYYGGKARFAKEISELLDYDNTNVYIEPFGGAGSVLLNKHPHKVEIYSDLSRGLVALMDCLSKPGIAEELIAELYETDYSEETFEKYLEYKKQVDKGILEGVDDLELAKATYVVYSMSRDGMGTAFSKNKYSSNEHYYKCIDKLYAVAERLEGVHVTGAISTFMYTLGTTFSDSLSKYTNVSILDKVSDKLIDEKSKRPKKEIARDIIEGNIKLKEFIASSTFAKYDSEKTMIYLDPPYLAEGDNRDLGRVYTGKMSQEQHIMLLETIKNSKAKILISNYDNEIYSSALSNWNKMEIETVTGVGGYKNNKRVECLWYNY